MVGAVMRESLCVMLSHPTAFLRLSLSSMNYCFWKNMLGMASTSKADLWFFFQSPYSGTGSDKWTEKIPYPGWAIFVVVTIVLASTLPILIWLIKDWPKNWRASFHKTFFTGLNNYLPDPKKEETPEAPHKGARHYAVEGRNIWGAHEHCIPYPKLFCLKEYQMISRFICLGGGELHNLT